MTVHRRRCRPAKVSAPGCSTRSWLRRRRPPSKSPSPPTACGCMSGCRSNAARGRPARAKGLRAERTKGPGYLTDASPRFTPNRAAAAGSIAATGGWNRARRSDGRVGLPLIIIRVRGRSHESAQGSGEVRHAVAALPQDSVGFAAEPPSRPWRSTRRPGCRASPTAPEAPQEAEAVQLGHHQVEQHEPGLASGDRFEARSAVLAVVTRQPSRVSSVVLRAHTAESSWADPASSATGPAFG